MAKVEIIVETIDEKGFVIEKNTTFCSIITNKKKEGISHSLMIGKFQYLFDDEGEIKGHGNFFDGITKSERFGLTDKQDKEIKEWKDHIKGVFGEYGKFDYTFTPNEIGDTLSVYSYIADVNKDFTDLDSW